MKKVLNLTALVVLVSVNVFTPLSYAQENPEAVEGTVEKQEVISENPVASADTENNEVVLQNPKTEENIEKPETPSAMDIISDVVEEYKETQQEEPKLDGENKVEEGNNTEEIVVPGENVDEGANLGAPVDADEGVVETMAEGTQTSQDGCYTYNLVDGGIEIVSYSGSCSKFVDLSNGIDGYDVISIASNAFYNKSVTGVVLGNTVETVSAYSFPFLEYIKIGKKVKYLGYNAFRTRERNENAYKYTDVEFEEGFDYDGLEVERGDNDNWAYDFQNSWFFILGGKNNCMVFDVSKKEIFEYICQENTVEIPMKISGFVVESIAESINCTKYSTFHNNIPGTLTLPSTIIKIGNEAACFIDGSMCMFSIDEGMENYLSTTELLPVIGSNLVRVKPYSGQELSPLLTDEMLSAACMYISEEHTVKFYDENGDFIKQITVEGYIDFEDVPSVEEREGYQYSWINQYGEVYNGEVVTEDLMLTLRYKRVGIIYENGIIKVSDGENEIWIRDRNVGVSDAAVKWLKIMNIESECGYDEACFVNKVNGQIGMNYSNTNEIYNYLNELEGEMLEGVVPEEEVEAFKILLSLQYGTAGIREDMESKDSEEFENIFEVDGGEVMFNGYLCRYEPASDYVFDVFCTVDGVEYVTTVSLETDLETGDSRVVVGEISCDPEQILEKLGNRENAQEYLDKFDEGYYQDLVKVQPYGNYYFWGNNGYATYDEMNFDNYGYSTEILQDAVDRGFIEGGKMDEDNTGWEEGKSGNPCDATKGEYLPSAEDWVKLMQIWANLNEANLDDVRNGEGRYKMASLGTEWGEIGFHNYGDYPAFANNMLLPSAGGIEFSPADGICDASLDVQSCDTNEWIYRNNYYSYLRSAKDDIDWIGVYSISYGETVRGAGNGAISDSRAYPVRCFVMANPVTVKYILGENEEVEQSVEAGKATSPIAVPEKEGYYFLGWYQDPTYSGGAFDFSMPIEEDITLYARRGQIIYNDGDITYTDTNGKVFGGMGTITFTNGVNSITMLDRNLGSTATGTGENSYGYYFQWGNNYGFLPGENDIDTERVDVTGYGWNNPYVSNVFVVNTGQRNYSKLLDEGEEEFADGLWGGFGDYRDNTWDSSEGHDYMRQGPCPDGYHVPSGGEWIDLITIWSDANNVMTSPNDKLAINTSRHSEYYDFLEDFYVPLMGRMDYNVSISSEPIDGGSIVASIMENVKIKNKNKFAYAWSSSPYYLTADGGYELYGDSRRLAVGPNAKSHGSIERSNGFPVRCFKDNYEDGNEPLILSYDTRGGSQIQAQTIPAGEKQYLPGYTTHRTGYELLGWYDDKGELELDGNKITNRTMEADSADDGIVTIYARWSDDHVVTFKDYDGSVIKVVLVRDGGNAQIPADPTRDGYNFIGWDKDLTNITEDLDVVAQYSAKSGGGYSGGGSKSGGENKDSHGSADNKEEVDSRGTQSVQGKTLDTTVPSKEVFNAHQWAYSNGLTKYRNASEARMDDPLNRSEMAKISSIFAIQFLDKVPNEKKKEFCSQYPDLWKVESDMQFFITESCELGYMGYESNGIDALAKFRPYTPVTVAEAATILSRIVWGNDNAMNGKDWYKGHLYATYNHGLIDNIKDPTTRSITRREAYLMLYRLINVVKTN